jgi:hypothetical protein
MDCKHALTVMLGIANKARINFLLTAKASTTEEPREGKLHAGICVGVSGNWCLYPEPDTRSQGVFSLLLFQSKTLLLPRPHWLLVLVSLVDISLIM